MKRIIDVDENLICEGFVRNFTEEEKDILINAIRNSIPYEERPQGTWRSCKQGDIPITDRCTNCNYEMKWYKNKHKYYPNCGAEMRNEQNK